MARDRKPAEPTAQTDIEGIPVEYARPPETRPERERPGAWLEQRTHEYDEAWRTGVIEGALWVLGEFLAEHPDDDYVLEQRILADLRSRFGDEHVARRIAQVST